MCDYILIHGLSIVLLDGQALRRNLTGKLMTKKPEEEVCGQTFLNGQKM